MVWILLIVLPLLIAVPPYIAWRRRYPMNAGMRSFAPGKFASLSGGRTHYQWSGPHDGEIAVCVHGLTTPSYVWDAMVLYLNRMGYRVLTYDLYGRGFSDRVRGRQDAEFFISQLEDLLEDQEIDGGFMLLGYSMGGAIATCYAAKHPEMLERMVLVAPAGLVINRSRLQEFIFNTPIIGDWLMMVFGGWMLRKGIRADSSVPSQVPDIYTRQMEDTYIRGLLPAVLSSMRNLLAGSLEEEHRKIAKAGVPVAAIWGEKDQVIPISGLGKLTELNRNVRQTMIPGAPHSLPYTHPEETIKAIQEFLREV